MTREEAKEKYISQELCPAQCNFIIDTLFDDFESKMCENCKYKGCAYMILAYESEGLTAEEFGCNQFKRIANAI